jgi:hypothetical protein
LRRRLIELVPKTESDEYAQVQLNLYGFKEEYKCLTGSEFRDLRRKPGQTGPAAARDSAPAPKSWRNDGLRERSSSLLHDMRPMGLDSLFRPFPIPE